MNLPDSYTGMFVKISHGSEIQVSETVDAKVSPKWLSTNSANTSKANRRRTSAVLGPAAAAAAVGFEFSDNDLHLHVEPQQTGGSIRLSVVAERYKKHVELGVVNIPIGTAIATCIDAAQDMEMPVHSFLNDIPMYTRWFPLTESNLTVPVAGDMGLSGRPQEHEQLRDHMFSNYFSPCIQLSLIWWYVLNKIGLIKRYDATSSSNFVLPFVPLDFHTFLGPMIKIRTKTTTNLKKLWMRNKVSELNVGGNRPQYRELHASLLQFRVTLMQILA